MQSWLKRYMGKGMGKGYRASAVPVGLLTFQHFHVFHNPEAPRTLNSWNFYGASSHKLNQSLTQSLVFLPFQSLGR